MADSKASKFCADYHIPYVRWMEGPRTDGKEYDFEGQEELLAKLLGKLGLLGFEGHDAEELLVYMARDRFTRIGSLPAKAHVYHNPPEAPDPSWNAWTIAAL